MSILTRYVKIEKEMNDKIQISEEQAEKMLGLFYNVIMECSQMNKYINKLKKEGYIKKSKLEEARDICKKVIEYFDDREYTQYSADLKKVLQVIGEIKDDKNNLKGLYK